MRLKALARTLFTIVLLNTLSAVRPAAAQTLTQPNPQQATRASANYGNLPLTFEANRGQTGAQVKFLSRGPGYTAFLTAGGITLSLRPNQPAPVQQTNNLAAVNQSLPVNTTLQFKLVGAAPNPAIIGEDPQPGTVNYFIGKDSTKWLTHVPTYARVRYKNVYPGIDLVYYGNRRHLEYDFAVSPGTDPGQIRFEITGGSQMELDGEGNLVLQTASGQLRFQSPVIYQESSGQRVPVSGSYVMNDATHISFHVAQYDLKKPLVIDPVLLYGTYLGGTGADQASGIAVDSAGGVYIAGYTNSADFSLTTFGTPATSANHVFVAKLDPTGSSLVYADYIGGNSDDYGIGLALDSSNNVYVTGITTSSDFPTVNAYQSVEPGSDTGFLSKISADGSSLVYSTYLGGSGIDQPAGVAVDTQGEAYVAGATSSQDFPVVNAYQSTALANQGDVYGNYGFLTKFTASGSSLSYSTYFGGNTDVVQNCGSPCYPAPYSAISAVALDADGDAFVAGTTNTSNFPVTSGAYLTSNSTQQDATVGFVSEFGSSGSLDYSTYFYGSSGNSVAIAAIAVDASGSAYIAGTVASDTTFPITSTAICDPSVEGFGCSYAFVSKFSPTAATLLYSTFLGPDNYASPQSIALDSNNNAYVVASTNSTAFATNSGIEGFTNGESVLLVEIDASGTTQLFATYLGGSGDDFASGITVDATGNIYVAGSTDSSDFPVTQGALQNVLGGSTDTFVVKIGPNAAASVALSPSLLQYAQEAVGSTSAAQLVLLRNMGSAALNISSITSTGDFAETDNCGTDVPAGSGCTLSITFVPTNGGLRSGSIVIQDDAAGAPHVINLSGTASGPAAIFAPTSLTFSAPVGTSSPAQSVILANSGTAALSINNIQVTGDYSQTNNCPATLASGSNCTFNITFTPSVSGTGNGTLALTDNLPDSPQTITFTGNGYVNTLVFAPASLTFGSQILNSSSAAQVVVVTNPGSNPVTVSGVAASGDFGQTNNCSIVAASGGTCAISVTFTPTAAGSRTGTVSVTDNAQGSPQTVSLIGTGSNLPAPSAILTPTSITFSAQEVGTASGPQIVTLSNSGSAALSVSSILVTGDYSQTNNCPASLAAGSACAISITFNATNAGTRTGTLTIVDNSTGSPQTVTLAGSGLDFSLASAQGSNTVTAGSAANYNLTITPMGGSFAYPVKLACSGLPAETSCTLSPATVTPDGTAVASTLSITTAASTAEARPMRPSRRVPVYAAWIQWQGICFFGMVLAAHKRSIRKRCALILLALLVVAMLSMSGCAGGTGIAPVPGSGTASGTYTITVTGTSGSLQHSIPVTLKVQ